MSLRKIKEKCQQQTKLHFSWLLVLKYLTAQIYHTLSLNLKSFFFSFPIQINFTTYYFEETEAEE